MKRGKRAGNALRMMALLVVLAVAIVGGVWEFGFTRPGYQNAILAMETITRESREEARSRSDIDAVLNGKQASSEYQQFELQGTEGTSIRFQRKDHYRWTPMIPGKTQMEFFVLYDRVLGKSEAETAKPEEFNDQDWSFKSFYEPGNAPVMATVTARKRPMEETLFDAMDEDVDGFVTRAELPSSSSILKQMEIFDSNQDNKVSFEEFKAALETLEKQLGRPLTQQEHYAFVGGQSPGEGLGSNGEGQKNGGQRGAGRPGGEGFDLGAFFDRMDGNQDGSLSGDEIPERMQDRAELMDKDKDGKISKQEFMEAPRRSPAGGRGPGGRGQGKKGPPSGKEGQGKSGRLPAGGKKNSPGSSDNLKQSN